MMSRFGWAVVIALFLSANATIISINTPGCGGVDESHSIVPEAHAVPTSTRPGGKLVFARPGGPASVVVPPVSVQASPPSISMVSPSSVVPGDSVTFTGTGLGSVSSVAHNGYSWSITSQSSTSLTATVAEAPAFVGVATLTNPAGSGTSSNITLNNAWLDMTAAVLPPGITPVRSSSAAVYLQTGAATVASVSGTGADIAEDRGDGLGRLRWSLRDMANDLGSSHSNFAATGYSLQGGLTRTASAATGPDGVAASATKLTDASGAATGYLQYLGTVDNANAINVSAVWVKDDPGDAPTLDPSGAIFSYNGHIGLTPNVAANIPNGLGWKRVVDQWVGSSQYAYSLFFGAEVPPLASQPSNSLTKHDAATGSILVWGASSYHAAAGDVYNAPLAAGSLGNLSWQFSAGAVAQLYSGSDLHLEIDFFSDDYFTQDGGVGEAWTLFSASTPSGAHKVRWTHASQAILYMTNGSEVNGGTLAPPVSTLVRLEPWNVGGALGTQGLHVWLNGARGITGTSVGVDLTSPTAAWLGSDLGVDGFAPLRHRRIRKVSRGIDLAEGVILGDSLVSSYPGAHSMMGTRLYTTAEAIARDGIISYATPGETALQQYSRWQTAPQRGQATTKWVVILVGVNDISTGSTGATTISRLNTLTADIRSSTPGAKILIFPLLPTAANLTSDQKTYFDQINQAIAGAGGTPITNVDYRGGLWTTLAHNGVGDSTSDLAAAYLTNLEFSPGVPDTRHQNEAGTTVIATTVRAALVSLGLLP